MRLEIGQEKHKEKWPYFNCRYLANEERYCKSDLIFEKIKDFSKKKVFAQFFDISTPSPLKMASKVVNISKMTIF